MHRSWFICIGLLLLSVQACTSSSTSAGTRPTALGTPPVASLSTTQPPSATRLPPTALGHPSASTALAPRPTGVVARVIPAAGVEQWLHCQGAGALTVLVVPGLGATASSWASVLPSLQRVTRTCVYDRPGLGRSPARPLTGQIVDAGLYAAELDALLQAAHEPAPYVLIGHSYGGLIARAFVHRYPATVRALLLAESVTPGDPTLGRYWTEAGHAVDMVASSSATAGGPHLGRRPLLVLSASNPEEDHMGGPTYGQPQWMINLWRTEQGRDLSLSSDAIQVIAHSGHVLQQDNPAAVTEALREIVRAAISGRPLACSSVWQRLGASCR